VAVICVSAKPFRLAGGWIMPLRSHSYANLSFNCSPSGGIIDPNHSTFTACSNNEIDQISDPFPCVVGIWIQSADPSCIFRGCFGLGLLERCEDQLFAHQDGCFVAIITLQGDLTRSCNLQHAHHLGRKQKAPRAMCLRCSSFGGPSRDRTYGQTVIGSKPGGL
jgi:hypothetical protein